MRKDTHPDYSEYNARNMARLRKPINLDWEGWHVWSGACGVKVFANGPDKHNRHCEFADVDAAINWLYMSGNKELARELHKHNQTR